ncbi:cytochrome b556 subunit of succinate dehydrogenase [Trichodelitschia bisporula]|uniref:Cytochrome b556 subunit of succinate dehydrogenase n=1 Tax=Trichodelitschia bisporula TaxID=703511 RepID=A0A6G1IA70_9PEZI|nr:cytochrome b556 subunit of succinate dehydrogenase [Trichodelitschia bisporula]
MSTSRILQTSARRALIRPTSLVAKFAPPAAFATNTHYVQRRQVTQQVSQSTGEEILAKQRLRRPVSPHLSIYQPQITWYLSALNRITGVALSGSLYLFSAAYLASPLFGWHLESSAIAASFAAWPIVAKVLTKSALAFPFVFHTVNSLRHLTWDMAKQITNKQVQQTGWAAVGATAILTLYLAVGL